LQLFLKVAPSEASCEHKKKQAIPIHRNRLPGWRQLMPYRELPLELFQFPIELTGIGGNEIFSVTRVVNLIQLLDKDVFD